MIIRTHPVQALTILTAALIVVLTITAGTASAATSHSGEIRLQGRIAPVCQVTVTDLGASLDLVSGERATRVATVEEHCNNHDGYTIAFTSQNSGMLTSGHGAEIAYTMSYGSAQNRSLTSQVGLERQEPRYGEAEDLLITVEPGSTRIAGTYGDTITVTISAN